MVCYCAAANLIPSKKIAFVHGLRLGITRNTFNTFYKTPHPQNNNTIKHR